MNGKWELDNLYIVIPEQVKSSMVNVKLFLHPSVKDRYIWSTAADGIYLSRLVTLGYIRIIFRERLMAASKDIIHCFRECPFARDVWESVGLPQNSLLNDRCFQDWVKQVDTAQLNLFWATVWVIWLYRNKCCFAGENHSIMVQRNEIIALRRDIDFVYPALNVNVKHPRLVSWTFPPYGVVALNTDGSAFG
ncbi:hypothetical protein SESBI_37366 [Sesbania bispinosa]|nr:hypothetical protein SESBI_37366 [Sesbania bispinosa]